MFERWGDTGGSGERPDGRGRPSSKRGIEANPGSETSSCDGEGSTVPKSCLLHCQEKPLASKPVPVPETDTGRRGENPKVRGITLVKELGKMAP